MLGDTILKMLGFYSNEKVLVQRSLDVETIDSHSEDVHPELTTEMEQLTSQLQEMRKDKSMPVKFDPKACLYIIDPKQGICLQKDAQGKLQWIEFQTGQ